MGSQRGYNYVPLQISKNGKEMISDGTDFECLISSVLNEIENRLQIAICVFKCKLSGVHLHDSGYPLAELLGLSLKLDSRLISI